MVTKEGEKNRLLSGSGSISGADNSIDINPFEVVIAKDDAIDLSSPDGENVETANCYVAGLAGTTYKFPATVMGNGLTLAADPSYAPSTGGTAPGIVPSPLAPVSATILWQTERDNEHVNIFAAVGNLDIHPDGVEVEEGAWWSMDDIESSIGQGIFTPNFEDEFIRIRSSLLALL